MFVKSLGFGNVEQKEESERTSESFEEKKAFKRFGSGDLLKNTESRPPTMNFMNPTKKKPAFSDFTKIKELGSGKYGRVLLVRYLYFYLEKNTVGLSVL